MFETQLDRRGFLGVGAAVVGGAALGGTVVNHLARSTTSAKPDDTDPTCAPVAPAAGTPLALGWSMPPEGARHARTWMSWPTNDAIYGQDLGPVQDDIAGIANTISGYEPVYLVIPPSAQRSARRKLSSEITMVDIATDDLWMRDTGPVFVTNGAGGLAGVVLNFNGWGNHQTEHANDSKVAAAVLDYLGIQAFTAPFVAEGGAFVHDGQGTVLCTESSVVNPDRNPGKTKAQLTTEITNYLSAQTVIWTPGLTYEQTGGADGGDVTDDHMDSLARFVVPGRVIVDQSPDPDAQDVWAKSEREALAILSASTDARGRTLQCGTITESTKVPSGFSLADGFDNVYVNWYECNDAVIIPSFADRTADANAKALVRSLYPGRTVEQLRIDYVAAYGGGVHCSTQQQPLV